MCFATGDSWQKHHEQNTTRAGYIDGFDGLLRWRFATGFEDFATQVPEDDVRALA